MADLCFHLKDKGGGGGETRNCQQEAEKVTSVSKGETIQRYKCSREGLNICVILIYKRDKFNILQHVQLLCGP